MTRRLYQTFALTVAAMLYLLNTLPVQAERENTPQIRPTATKHKKLPAQTKTIANKKNTRQAQKKRRQQRSAFVTLDHFILDAKAYLFFDNDVVNKDDHLISEAYGPLGAFAEQPLFLATGKANRFFGQAATPILQRPLSVASSDFYDLGIIAGFESNLLETYSGSNNQQRTFSNGTGKGSGFPFAYSYKADNSVSLKAGISWTRDISDFSGMSKAFEETGYESSSDKMYGFNLNFGASFRAFTLTGGYIRALGKFTPTPLFLDESETEPSAWNGELAYTTELLHKETVLAVGYLKSSESLNLYLPEQRYITKASMALFDSTILSLEYYLDKDYATETGGTDEDGYGITTKIGFGF